MFKREEQKGITLISLVITIILLLILATVAISLAIDSDGLFSKAGDAANKWNTSVAEEGTELENLMLMANSLGGTTPPTSTLPDGWEIEKVAGVVEDTETNRKAPIPVGYVASQIPGEDTISDGLVIYEGTEEVTGTKGSTEHENAMTTRNQFVWIPVDDIDYMVMCKSNNKLADSTGNKTCDLEVVEGSLQCTNSAHAETAMDLCGRMYATTSSSETVNSKTVSTYNMTFTADERATQVWDTSSYREPDIVSEYDKDDVESGKTYMVQAGITSGLVSDFEAQLKSDFRVMAESVAKYGGFYIARYEVGLNGASKKNQEVMVAGTAPTQGANINTYIAEMNMWYGLYNKLKTSAGINKEAVSSHMIWGCQYDMVINFLKEDTSNEPFKGHTSRQLNSQVKTGSNSADEMSNVYDLEGNNYEWTAQAKSTNGRRARGGDFFDVVRNNTFYPASFHRSDSPTYVQTVYSTRSTLYL